MNLNKKPMKTMRKQQKHLRNDRLQRIIAKLKNVYSDIWPIAAVFVCAGMLLETVNYATCGSLRFTQSYKVIGKKDKEIAIQHNNSNATYVLSFEDRGYDSIVYNRVNVGDQLTVKTFSRSKQKQVTIPNNRYSVMRINGNKMRLVFKEYDDWKKTSQKEAAERAKEAKIRQITARSNIGR